MFLNPEQLKARVEGRRPDARKVWLWYAVLLLVFGLPRLAAWWMAWETQEPSAYLCDPVSGSILASIAISAAFTAASYAAQILLTPKPAPIIRGKFDGDLQFTTSRYGIMLPKVYGGAPVTDRKQQGGVKIGGNVIFGSGPPRRHETRTRSTRSGKGPKQPDEIQVTYDIDLGVMVCEGPALVKRIWADFDLIYNDIRNVGDYPLYQAEAAGNTLSNAAVVTCPACSGGQKVSFTTLVGSIVFNNVDADAGQHTMTVFYTASADSQCNVIVNGGAAQTVQFPAGSASAPSVKLVSVTLNAGLNTIQFLRASFSAAPSIDAIRLVPLSDSSGTRGPGLSDDGRDLWTGIYNPDLLPRVPYTAENLPSPNGVITDGAGRFGRLPAEDATGAVSQQVVAGAYAGIRIYEGNWTQLPDPTVQSAIDAKYGVNSTPAYRGRCYVVFEKFYLTKYGRVPNFTFLVEHKELKTLELIAVNICQQAGLQTGDYDFSAAGGALVRGTVMNNRSAPRSLLEQLAEACGFDFVETGGQVIAVPQGQASAVTIPEVYVGAFEGLMPQTGTAEDAPPPEDYATRVREDVQAPRRLDVKFFDPDPAKDYETNTAGTIRQVAGNQKRDTIEVPITMTKEEAQVYCDRKLAQIWMQMASSEFSLMPRFGFVRPTDVLTIKSRGFRHQQKLMTKRGSLPGFFSCSGLQEDVSLYVAAPEIENQQGFRRLPVGIPKPSVGTIIDLPPLRDADEGLPVMYGAMAPLVGFGDWRKGTMWVDREDGPELVATFDEPCIMGVAVGVLPPFPSAARYAGATYAASSTSGAQAASRAFDGTRTGASSNWWQSSGNPSSGSPQTLDVDFGASRTIDRVEVVSQQDSGNVEPTEQMTGTSFVLQAFKIQYWTGSAWADVPGATVTGNSKIVVPLQFRSPVATTKLRLSVTAAAGGSARVVEFGTFEVGTAFDRLSQLDFDLYWGQFTTATEAQVSDGANALVWGREVIGAASIVKLAGFENRWRATTLRRGLRDTEKYMKTHAASERVVSLDAALQPIRYDVRDKDVEREYAALTDGESWDDASHFTHTLRAESLIARPVENPAIFLDASGDFHIAFDGRPRAYEQPLVYKVNIRSLDGLTDKGTLVVYAQMTQAAILNAFLNPPGGGGSVVNNNVTGPTVHAFQGGGFSVRAKTVQQIRGGASAFLEGRFQQFWDGGDQAEDFAYITVARESGSTPEAAFCFKFSQTGFKVELWANSVLLRTFTNTGDPRNPDDVFQVLDAPLRIMFVGNEVRFYAAYASGKQPLAVVTNHLGFSEPLQGWIYAYFRQKIVGLTINTGEAVRVSTIWSVREQKAMFAGVQQTQLVADIWQETVASDLTLRGEVVRVFYP